jgi:exodeoxyribonuclease-1
VFARPAPSQAPDVDEDLYGGFLSRDDRIALDRLRALNPEQLAERRTGFEDPRLDELWFRYRARNFPQTLSGSDQERWHQLRVERLIEGAGGGLSLQAFFDRIDELSENTDERGQDILGALYDYAEQIAP